MANNNLESFQTSAVEFLDDEINDQLDAIDTISNSQASAISIANANTAELIGKSPLGAAKSISDHLSEFASSTTNFLNNFTSTTQSSLKGVISAFNREIDVINGSQNAALASLVSEISAGGKLVFSLSKKASNKASRKSAERVEIASDLIAIIDEIRAVRANVVPGVLSSTPEDAAESALGSINNAISLMNFVSLASGRRPVSYEQAMENLSDALDSLKIGSGTFAVHEYMRLRLDYKVLVGKYDDANADIVLTTTNFINTKTEFSENKDQIYEAEKTYLNEIISLLISLSNDINEVLKTDNDNLTLESFPEWSNTLMAIYTMAHGAYDSQMEARLNDADDPDNISFESAKTSIETIYTELDSEALVASMNDLGDNYYEFLLERVTEAELVAQENSIKTALLTVAQYDQQVVSIDSSYTPSVSSVLDTVANTAKRAGFDKISEAIINGSVGDFFTRLTKSTGSRAGEVSNLLSSEIMTVENAKKKELLLKVNNRIQAINRKRLLAGAVRDGNVTDPLNELNRQINKNKRLKEQLAALDL